MGLGVRQSSAAASESPSGHRGRPGVRQWACSVRARMRRGGGSGSRRGPTSSRAASGKGSKVQAHVGPWTVTLDTHTGHTGHAHFTYTRMRAPYVNPEGFRFTVYRNGLFSGLGKFLGMQDIEVGDT